MDLLLIIPPYHRRLGSGVIFPLGLGYIAAVAERAGFSVSILDCAAQCHSLDKPHIKQFEMWLRGLLPNMPPRIAIGIGPCTTSALRGIQIVADICKSVFPNIPLIFGGPLVGLPDSNALFLNQFKADAVVLGDGEVAIAGILNGLMSGSSLDELPGVVTSSVSKLPNIVTDLDDLPFPNRDALILSPDYRLSIRRDLFRNPFATIMASRGCPHHCDFCISGSSRNGVYSRRSIRNIILEMKYLVEQCGIRTVVFYDDCFFPSATHLENDVLEFTTQLNMLALDINWEIEMRPEVVYALNSTLANTLYLSGCRQINIGIETANMGLSAVLGKPANPELLRKSLSQIKRGAPALRLTGTFILGGPGETEDTIAQTVEYAKSLGLLFAHFYPLEIYPGTKLYESIYGIIPADWLYQRVISDDLPWGEIIYENQFLSRDSLLAMVNQAYNKFYNDSCWHNTAVQFLGSNYSSIAGRISMWINDRFNLRSSIV